MIRKHFDKLCRLMLYCYHCSKCWVAVQKKIKCWVAKALSRASEENAMACRSRKLGADESLALCTPA
eukprot:c51252_g1_i1 orf=118-318(+)